MNYFTHSLCTDRTSSIIIKETLRTKYKLKKFKTIDSFDCQVVTLCVCCGDKKWEDIKKEFEALIW